MPSLKVEVRRRLDEIASQTFAHIAVVNAAGNSRTPPDSVSPTSGWSGFETERMCELVVTGTADAVDFARVRLLVMLDELSGLHAESCEVDYKLHNIISGRKRSALQKIQEETATNIYLPSPLQGLVTSDYDTNPKNGSPGSPAPGRNGNMIWITGEFFGAQRARDMLLKLAATKGSGLSSRDTAILPRKLDWMVTDRQDDLKTIMSDNGTFIQFPPLGSSASLITLFGDHRVNIQRSIRSVMQLVHVHILLLSITFLPLLSGLQLLCWLLLAPSCSIQCSPPPRDSQFLADRLAPQAD